MRRVCLPRDLSPEDEETMFAAAANQDDARERVRELLARRADLMDAVGTMASQLEVDLISEATGPQMLLQEALLAEYCSVMASLRQAGDGPLEELLIRQVALSWLQLMLAQKLREQKWRGGVGSSSADFWDRHVSRLQGDFMRATKTLAGVRKLMVPAMQVNIGAQQVNQILDESR